MAPKIDEKTPKIDEKDAGYNPSPSIPTPNVDAPASSADAPTSIEERLMRAKQDASKETNKYFVRKYKKDSRFSTLNDGDKNLLDNLTDKEKIEAKDKLETVIYENAMKINYLNQLLGVEENTTTDENVNVILNYKKVEKPLTMKTNSTLKDFKVEAFKKHEITHEKVKSSIKFFIEKGGNLKELPHAKSLVGNVLKNGDIIYMV